MLDEDPNLDFAGFEPNDLHQVNDKDVENWLEESDSDPGYEVLSSKELSESELAGDQPGESGSSDSEDVMVVRKNVSNARFC